MNKVFKSEQVYALSEALGVTQTDTKKVLDSYINRLRTKVDSGETVRFLNICYLVNRENKKYFHETLAYISTEIGIETKLGKELVFRILSTYEDMIVQDLRKFYSYVVRGLVRISVTEYRKGVYRVRVNKSINLLNADVRVVTLNSFKRKVESYDRKDT